MNSTPWQPLSRFQQWQQRLQALPLPETEESIALRIVVQILVIIGIIATDVASETTLYVWAVPLSVLGAAFSWWRRKQRNVAVKFALALGMLLALMSFLGNLIENLNDTIPVLTELLVQVQVLHSFDLPRRKDLGYSSVIGLMLMSMAASRSQTTFFLVFIALFLAFALPSMVLDYRSQLGLSPLFETRSTLKDSTIPAIQSRRSVSRSWWALDRGNVMRWTALFLSIFCLGLLSRFFMPQSSGYWLDQYPVAVPREFSDLRFDGENRGIINPGRVADPDAEDADVNVDGQAVSPEIFYSFNSTFDQTQVPSGPPGKPELLMRVRSQAPGFWRVIAFDRYTSQGWEISREDQTLTIRRPTWSYRFAVTLPDPPKSSQRVIQTYSIVKLIPNLLPVLSRPSAIYFPTPELAIDTEGSLRAPAALSEELTYTVVSNAPIRDRTQLGQANQDYPERISKYYLQLPEGVAEEVRPIAEELLNSASNRPDNPYEIALFLAQALKQNYAIKPNLIVLPGADLTTAFLNQGGGYGDHFSTVLAVMLRSLGIPARIASGFAPGQFNPFTGFYLVRTSDVLSVTEVFFPEQGWYTFNPIPGHEIIPPSFVDNETFGALRQAWNWVAGWLPSPVRGWLSGSFAVTVGSLLRLTVWFWRWMSSGLVSFLVGLIALTAAAFGVWIASLGLGRWWQHRRLFRLPPMERIYRQMLLVLANKGDRKSPAQTPLEYAHACEQRYPEAIATPIQQITQAYLYWRYNEQPPDLMQMQKALRLVRQRLRLRTH
ncbi:MAG: DUF4129 domain-containing protein [Spirulina sp. SIO3F2]|nr:DUF4129 domain-containing protein [Spirulina sp. SIO3F2]